MNDASNTGKNDDQVTLYHRPCTKPDRRHKHHLSPSKVSHERTSDCINCRFLQCFCPALRQAGRNGGKIRRELGNLAVAMAIYRIGDVRDRVCVDGTGLFGQPSFCRFAGNGWRHFRARCARKLAAAGRRFGLSTNSGNVTYIPWHLFTH